jgi:MYXO-CTERM domain-containing protein
MTPTKKAATMAAFGSLMTFSAVSFAHVDLSQPTPRAHGQNEGNLKQGPCGQATNARTANVNVFAPGQTITVEWNEFIDHPSYFRIAFDDDGDDGFVQRTDGQNDADADDPEAVEAALGMDAEILAIVGEENDTTAGTDIRSTTVTLPNIECENCTLQLIQYMYDNPGTGYFQCADIALRAAQEVEPGDAGVGGVGGGAADAGSGGTGGSANAGTAGNGGAPAAGGAGATGGSASNAAGTGGGFSSAGTGGASAGAVGSPLPINPQVDIDNGNEDDGGCSIPTHVGMSTKAPGLIGLLGLALGALGRRRRAG